MAVPTYQGYGATNFAKSSGYYKNNFHTGLDINLGENVPAVRGGKVIQVGDKNDGFGGTILIQGDDGKVYRYSHLRGFNVKVGDAVPQGTTIGLMGGGAQDQMRGTSTGRHLHFQVEEGGKTIDPTPFLDMNYKPSQTTIPKTMTSNTPAPTQAPRNQGFINWLSSLPDDVFQGKKAQVLAQARIKNLM